MRETRVAGRYAKALFDLAVEQQSLEEVNKDMNLIHNVISGSRDLLLLLKTPVVSIGKKNQILKAIFATHVSDLSMRFLELITKKGRELYVKEISHQFKLLYNKHHNIIEANLRLPVEDDSIARQLKTMLESHTHSNIHMTSQVDESLIGGFVLNFDDIQYDASLKKRLHNIKAQFADNLYLNKFR
jgi:F-type H+-transporting ATPase subunit delta